MLSFLEQLGGIRGRVKTFATRYRIPLYTIALVAFFMGLYVSFQHLNVDWKQLSYGYLVIVLLITQPLLIFLNSLELKLCAVASNAKMTIRDSVYISSSATIANIMPLPAGLVLRGAALIKGGGKTAMVSKVLLIAALMWIFVAITVSGAVIASGSLAILVMAMGLAAISLLLVYTCQLSNLKTALGFLSVRVLMVCILTVQLKFCFAVLSVDVNLQSAAVYVVSGIAGAVVSIVPAGLGITESSGALLAKLDGASSSLAYVVLSLNRLIGLSLAAVFVLLLTYFKKLPYKLESQ